MIGDMVLLGAGAMQGASHNMATFILAGFFVGAGIAMASLPAPVLVAEIAYPTQRGKVTRFCISKKSQDNKMNSSRI